MSFADSRLCCCSVFQKTPAEVLCEEVIGNSPEGEATSQKDDS